jgi:hypothetical protein
MHQVRLSHSLLFARVRRQRDAYLIPVLQGDLVQIGRTSIFKVGAMPAEQPLLQSRVGLAAFIFC